MWDETGDRYVDFMCDHLKRDNDYVVPAEIRSQVREAIRDQKIGPSMRALMTAGAALDRNAIAAYNCSYLPIDSPRSFDELLYILMNGTGVGFSVEKKYVRQLPAVADYFESTSTIIVVDDSKEGWAKAFRELVALLWAGRIPTWDLSQLRKAGARLKTFGGRASGPAPLDDLFRFTVALFTKAAGRHLTTIEAHDLVCKIASVVVVGGVRRSALISLSDLDDSRMASAKSGDWYNDDFRKQRALANNSVVYSCTPDMDSFMKEWSNLYQSKSGERGIFNREASIRQVGRNARRNFDHDFGTNPCSEIILRPYQFCNLSTVVVRPDDDLDTLREKVRLATILGTWQSTLTNFKYLRKIWKKNTEEERLLGVSMTGQLGHPVLSGQQGLDVLATWLEDLKQVAIDTNAEFADAIGIPRSAAITCVKPEGTSSQLFGAASGMHPWHNDYYIRTVRGDKKDPLTQFLIDVGIPAEDEIHNPTTTTVFSFPIKAPDGALTRKDLTAVEHLEIWRVYQESWCEHKPSVTISVRDHEWMEVGAWVYRNFEQLSGVSFLPYSEHIYQQAPYQDITKDEYEAAVAKMPASIRWADLAFFEREDSTTGSQELSCTAGSCDVVDIT
jgi:ribonucleoside-diphosphate reductase alpha chain